MLGGFAVLVLLRKDLIAARVGARRATRRARAERAALARANTRRAVRAARREATRTTVYTAPSHSALGHPLQHPNPGTIYSTAPRRPHHHAA